MIHNITIYDVTLLPYEDRTNLSKVIEVLQFRLDSGSFSNLRPKLYEHL